MNTPPNELAAAVVDMQAAIRYILRDFARKHRLNVNVACAYAAHDYVADDIEADCDIELILPPVTDHGAARPTRILTTARRTPDPPSRIHHAHQLKHSILQKTERCAARSSSFVVEA